MIDIAGDNAGLLRGWNNRSQDSQWSKEN